MIPIIKFIFHFFLVTNLVPAGDYLTKSPSNPGAGDILMGFLGSVIISFAFSMFKQRKVLALFPTQKPMLLLPIPPYSSLFSSDIFFIYRVINIFFFYLFT